MSRTAITQDKIRLAYRTRLQSWFPDVDIADLNDLTDELMTDLGYAARKPPVDPVTSVISRRVYQRNYQANRRRELKAAAAAVKQNGHYG